MTTESKGQWSSRPKNPGAVFESWLKKKAQQERDDHTGRVARWVHKKMAEGEWATTESQKLSQPFGGKRLPSDEQLLRTWRRHLRADHGINIEGIEIFEKVFAEYQRARGRYQEEVRQHIAS